MAAESAETAAPARERSLTEQTTHAFMWTTAATIASKLVASLGQLALAYILSKEDFGWIATALAIAAFPGALQSGGTGSVLIQRQARQRIYTNPCFWAGLMLAGTAAGLTLIAAPIAAWVSGSTLLGWLLVAVAFNSLLSGLGAIPYAVLQIQMRFREVAALNATNTITQMCAAVPLAYLGMGPMSVIAATTLGLVIANTAAWSRARPKIRSNPQLRRWRYILSDSMSLLGTNLLWTSIGQGDRLAIGAMQGRAQTGVYFFAYNLSMQVSGLIMINLSSILLPALGRFAGDPVRQLRAFLRAARMLALVGVPLTLSQAALADPVLRILFGEKWVEAIPVMQWFSIGMAAFVVSGAVTSLIMAQGRFRLLPWMAGGYLVVFACAFVAGVHFKGIVGGAAAVALCYWLSAFVGMSIGIHPQGGRLRDVLGVYALPVLGSVLGLVPGLMAAAYVPEGPMQHWIRATMIAGGMAVIYPSIVLLAGGESLAELRSLAGRFGPLGRFIGPKAD